jgi:hypothetical protein
VLAQQVAEVSKMALYMVVWEKEPNSSEEQLARAARVFEEHNPSKQKGVKYLHFVGRVDGVGGFALADTDDPHALAKTGAMFAPFFKTVVHPVMEIGAFAQLTTEAVAARQAIR